jgi:hypothetical protein
LLVTWAVAGLAGSGVATVRAETVDLQLVLTVDVSLSMDLDEQRLQRDGHVSAFRDAEVLRVIKGGPSGRIAVIYVEWAGIGTQSVVVPWTLIDGPVSASAFADALESRPISRALMTSISGALQFSRLQLETSPFRGARRVIDVSGDGPNNSGPLVEAARDALVASGIVINGLPIQINTGGPYSYFDIPNLDRYYVDCVIGGPGAFSIPVRHKSEIVATIRRKLILEIAGLMPLPDARLTRVQAAASPAPPERADCLIGEKLWQRYLLDNPR